MKVHEIENWAEIRTSNMFFILDESWRETLELMENADYIRELDEAGEVFLCPDWFRVTRKNCRVVITAIGFVRGSDILWVDIDSDILGYIDQNEEIEAINE